MRYLIEKRHTLSLPKFADFCEQAGLMDLLSEKRTIFHQLLDPNATEGHVVPPAQRMIDEGLAIVGAAGDTMGNALTVATFHTLYNPELLSVLTDELEKAFPDPNSRLEYLALKKLPYLVRQWNLNYSYTHADFHRRPSSRKG